MTPEQQAILDRLSGVTPRQREILNRVSGEKKQPQSWGEWAYGNVVGNPDDDVTNFGESLGTWLNRAGETASYSYVGDEASAAMYAPIKDALSYVGLSEGPGYEQELNRFRGNEENMSGFGQLSADVVGSLLPAAIGAGVVAGPAAAAKLTGLAGKIPGIGPYAANAVGNLTGLGASVAPASAGGRAVASALLGGAAGASQGFMEGEDGLADRLGGAVLGAGVGGTIGAVTPAIGGMVGRGVQAVDDWARNTAIGKQVGGALGIGPEAARVVTEFAGRESPQDVAAILARSGDEAMLADIPSLTGVLDATINSPAPGARMASDRISSRAASGGDEIMDAVRGGQAGPFVGPIAAERGINATTRAAANPKYEAAYNTIIDYATPEGMAIEDLMKRIPADKLNKAFNTATDRMVYDGYPKAQALIELAEDGTATLKELPNVMQLDYLKRAFDEIAQAGEDPLTGKLTPDAAFAARVARDIRNATKEAVPEYADALSTAATGIRAGEAVRKGGKILDANLTVEQARDIIKDATPAELRLIKDGLAAQFEHKIGNVKAVASDRSVDAREASRAWSDLSSRNTKEKLRMVFGDDWPQFEEVLDRAGSGVGLRADVAANTKTVQRQETNKMIDDITAPGAVRSGQPLNVARNVWGGMTGGSADAVASLRMGIRSEIADILTRQGGTPQQAISEISKALSANPGNPAAGDIAKILAELAGLSTIPTAVGGANEVFN